ncbi:MAG: hypothetical protein M1433_01090 [Candidatus Parvarchaeota archaeon]|nr:hypothetical protein [Candidatus Parvarchaeota archaeon]
MKRQRWEKAIEYALIGIIVFIGFVSLLYSWIDSAFGINVNVYLLAALAVVVSFLVVYIIRMFDER